MDRIPPIGGDVVDPTRRRPAGYETDAPVADLTPGELFPLSALRLWAAPHRRPDERHPDWRDGFALADLDVDAAAAFEAFMATLLATASATLDVRCARCPRLGADEATFLLAVGHLQRHRPLGATRVLARWMPPAAVRSGLVHLGRFARAAADADLWIPSVRIEARRIQEAGIDAGLTRVH
ncbi:hypothetical protein [Stella sp.]|uniref:hypothetical protein n=1 Tax=Stella sp. TaxID=2912054 RepID=UPI0035B25691